MGRIVSDIAGGESTGKVKLSLAVQLLGFLGLMACGSFLLLAGIHFHQQQQYGRLFENQSIEIQERLNFQIQLHGQTLQNFVYDYTYWDEMVHYVQKPDPKWAVDNLDSVLPSFQVDGVWILSSRFDIIHVSSRIENPLILPLNKNELSALVQKNYFSHFFVNIPQGLLELRTAPIQPGNDAKRLTEPRGWMLAGRLWNKELISDLEKTSGLSLQLGESDELPHTGDFESARIAFAVPLPGKDGQEAAHLHALRYIPIIAKFIKTSRHTIILVGLLSLCLFALVMWVFYLLVIKPLGRISKSVQERNPSLLDELALRQDEMGRLARQIQIANSHQEQIILESELRRNTENKLEQSLAEREEFARELHDDTLQTLFAAGMSVESVAVQLEGRDQAAFGRLKKAITEINRVMTSLRVAISGLEGRRIDPNRLESIIRRMLDTSAESEILKMECRLEPQALELLTREQGFHLVRVIRETLSNTIKHSKATLFRITLERKGAHPILVVEDNGMGLDKSGESTGGHGLHNLRERARQLGCSFELQSSPGSGLRIVLEFGNNENNQS